MSPEASQPSLALGGGAEFDAIRAMLGRWGKRATGIGDDAAVLHVPRGDSLVVSVDTTLEGRHFRTGWLSAREIGYRAVTAALSDLAAMAARPLGVLVAFNLSPSYRDSLADLADGIGDALEAAGTYILGGNVSAADTLGLTTTVLGSVFTPLGRDGLRPGDRIYVTGCFGGPAAAVAAWQKGTVPKPELRARFARPVARLREARWLADRGAVAAIDISDGLAADLEHLVAASDVGADIDLARLPLVDGLRDVIQAAASGEEYELLVGARAELDTAEFERMFNLPLTAIGRATSRDEGILFRRGEERVAKPSGYDHLSL
ncbi:MAG TPA: thiamine-phosphate kinase [Gemmatimonadaceae bacterium]